jgi:hypothetical protein
MATWRDIQHDNDRKWSKMDRMIERRDSEHLKETMQRNAEGILRLRHTSASTQTESQQNRSGTQPPAKLEFLARVDRRQDRAGHKKCRVVLHQRSTVADSRKSKARVRSRPRQQKRKASHPFAKTMVDELLRSIIAVEEDICAPARNNDILDAAIIHHRLPSTVDIYKPALYSIYLIVVSASNMFVGRRCKTSWPNMTRCHSLAAP